MIHTHKGEAQWTRVALQVNPYGYKGKNQPSNSYNNEADYNSALLDEFEREKVKIFAVTDHWSVDSARLLIEEAKVRGMIALPGFEANSSEGIHVLIIYPEGTDLSIVNAMIGKCGGTPGRSGTVGRKSFAEILQEAVNDGALAIPAHANAGSGLLTKAVGEALANKVKDRNLLALGISPNQEEAAHQREILSNQSPFKRTHPLAVVYADDIVNHAQVSQLGATTWLKLSELSLNGIELAFKTPETRIKLEVPHSSGRPKLERITWSDGFFKDITVPFSSDLTAIIGGRGSGKSTVIESIRFVLGQSPRNAHLKEDHDSIVSNVVKKGTVVKLTLVGGPANSRKYTIERCVGGNSAPVVRDDEGTVTDLRPEDVVDSIRIFGQQELAELAHDEVKVAELLLDPKDVQTARDELSRIRSKLEENRSALAREEDARSRLSDQLEEKARLEDVIKTFDDLGIQAQLEELGRSQSHGGFLDGTLRKVGELEAQFSNLESSFVGMIQSMAPFSPPVLTDGQERDLICEQVAAVGNLVSRLAESVESHYSSIKQEISSVRDRVRELKDQWAPQMGECASKQQDTVKLLVEKGIDPDRYLEYTDRLNALAEAEIRHAESDRKIETFIRERNGLLVDRNAAISRIEDKLKRAACDAQIKTNHQVVVVPQCSLDSESIIRFVRSRLSGQKSKLTAAIKGETFSIDEFVSSVRGAKGREAKLKVLSDRYGITPGQADSIISAGEEFLREFEEYHGNPSATVLLRIPSGSSKGVMKPITQLSRGQRATALLLLLLSFSADPLVIDQPEDDLDNRFIYNGVVRKLRELKDVRQVITCTHNANIPVIGDAELVVAFDSGSSGTIADQGIGSLDCVEIRGLIEDILEGGRAAFKKRQNLYGF